MSNNGGDPELRACREPELKPPPPPPKRLVLKPLPSIYILSMHNYIPSKMVSKPHANPLCATEISFIDFLLLTDLMGDCTAPVVMQYNSVKTILTSEGAAS